MSYEDSINIFSDYVKENYDFSNPLIASKYIHTLQVVKIMMSICKRMHLSKEDCDLAFYIALFHDLGRFKEALRQKEFNNLKFDHGAYSNKILFNDGLIRKFNISEEDYLIIKKALYYHNKKDISENVSDRERFFCELIRDADRVDIFRVLSNRNNVFDGVSSIDIINKFYNGESIHLKDLKIPGDRVVLRLGFIKLFSSIYALEDLKELGYFDNYIKSIKVSKGKEDLFMELIKEAEKVLKGEKSYVRKKI